MNARLLQGSCVCTCVGKSCVARAHEGCAAAVRLCARVLFGRAGLAAVRDCLRVGCVRASVSV
eukprot:6204283-Pleurochrysis_carterae.AAC.2